MEEFRQFSNGNLNTYYFEKDRVYCRSEGYDSSLTSDVGLVASSPSPCISPIRIKNDFFSFNTASFTCI